MLTGDEDAGRAGESGSDDDLFDFITKSVFDEFAEGFEFGLLFFEFLLFVFRVFEFKSFLGAVLEFLFLVVLQLLDDVLIDGVDEVEDFDVLLDEGFNEGRLGDGGSALSSDEEDIFLSLLHSGDVVLEGGHLLSTLG